MYSIMYYLIWYIYIVQLKRLCTQQCLVKKEECLPYYLDTSHRKNMTWQNYIHQGLYDVNVAKFLTCLISWSSPEIDMLDVCWGQPRQIILNWITLSQNTCSTLAKGCVKERNIIITITMNFPNNYSVYWYSNWK